jgi:hypothetical protein
MLTKNRALVLLLAVAALAVPAQAQFGGGGGGAGGGGGSKGIPLGSGGSQSSGDDKKDDKKNANERPVSGVVTDADGKPVSGAVVQLKNTRTQEVRSVITQEKGDYRFSGLNKDIDYEVKAITKDHASAPHTLSTYDPRPQPVVNLQIK